MKKKLIGIIFVITLIAILFSGCTEEDFVEHATAEDIDIIISPNPIIIMNCSENIYIDVELRNVANERKKINPEKYTAPTESIMCKFSTRNQSYLYKTEHYNTIDKVENKVLYPGKSFIFSFDIPLGEVRNWNELEEEWEYLKDENPISCTMYISLSIYCDSGDSNIIQINRN